MGTQAEDLVGRAVAGAPVTQDARDRLVTGATDDVPVRMQLRLAAHAHDVGDLDTWARWLWRALDDTRRTP